MSNVPLAHGGYTQATLQWQWDLIKNDDLLGDPRKATSLGEPSQAP